MPKSIFITGSSTGLGRATALLFASKSWRVIGRSVSTLSALESEKHSWADGTPTLFRSARF